MNHAISPSRAGDKLQSCRLKWFVALAESDKFSPLSSTNHCSLSHAWLCFPREPTITVQQPLRSDPHLTRPLFACTDRSKTTHSFKLHHFTRTDVNYNLDNSKKKKKKILAPILDNIRKSSKLHTAAQNSKNTSFLILQLVQWLQIKKGGGWTLHSFPSITPAPSWLHFSPPHIRTCTHTYTRWLHSTQSNKVE